MMKRTLYLLSFLILCGCSTRKFDFKSAYKFSHHRYTPHSVKSPETEPKGPLLMAVTDEVIVKRNSERKSLAPTPVTKRKSEFKASKRKSHISKEEKKQLLRSIKSTIKEIRRTHKSPDKLDVADLHSTNEITDNKVYAGAVIGIAGLILLILDIISPLGALAVVVGLGLIVWGLLERGQL